MHTVFHLFLRVCLTMKDTRKPIEVSPTKTQVKHKTNGMGWPMELKTMCVTTVVPATTHLPLLKIFE